MLIFFINKYNLLVVDKNVDIGVDVKISELINSFSGGGTQTQKQLHLFFFISFLILKSKKILTY